ncbi:MAG: hypothetical protein J2P25_23655, partial [Nocardiopsaceae bacterium]|nr:hypothetical protein [Nocardiopsaceae bacterium]
MTLSAHRITADQVRALADGTHGDAELEILLRGQRSKTLAMVELATRRVTGADGISGAAGTRARHPDAAAAVAGAVLLARVQ